MYLLSFTIHPCTFVPCVFIHFILVPYLVSLACVNVFSPCPRFCRSGSVQILIDLSAVRIRIHSKTNKNLRNLKIKQQQDYFLLFFENAGSGSVQHEYGYTIVCSDFVHFVHIFGQNNPSLTQAKNDPQICARSLEMAIIGLFYPKSIFTP